MATYTKETALYDTGAIATDILNAGTTATNYITYVDATNGIRVYDGQSVNQNVNFAQINSSGLQVYKGGTAASNKVAEFGETAQVGKSGSGHTSITSAGMKVYGSTGNVELANIGYGSGNAEIGTENAPYYTFGRRASNSAIGNYSMAEGSLTTASGAYSHAEGLNATASGNASHAEGAATIASGPNAHAEGNTTTASGYHSHVEGQNTTASGSDSHAEGQNTTASGSDSHAEGQNTTASGNASHAEGGYTEANGYASHAGGYYTIANGNYQTAIGMYNVADDSSLLIVGNGSSSDNARSNALKLDRYGNLEIAGKLDVGENYNVKLRAVTQTLSGVSPVQFEAERFGKFIYMTYKIGAITLGASSTVAILSLYSDIRPKYESIVPANITDSNYATVGTGLVRFETGGWVYLVAPKSLSQTSGLYVMFTALYLI